MEIFSAAKKLRKGGKSNSFLRMAPIETCPSADAPIAIIEPNVAMMTKVT
jgi:hypothetical protein